MPADTTYDLQAAESPTDADGARVELEQVRVTYSHTPTAAVSIPLGTAVYAWIFLEVADPAAMAIWWIAGAVLMSVRMGVFARFRSTRPGPEAAADWRRTSMLLAGLQGAFFGIGFTWFANSADTVHMVISVLWALGVSAISVSAFSADQRVLVAYFVPIVAPITAFLLFGGRDYGVPLGITLLLYAAVVLRAMRAVSQSLVEAIRLNFDLEREVLARRRVEDELRHLSTHDGLTGLANRRRFDEALEAECSRALRTGNPLSLIMIDIDEFKAFNDRYGHLGGDDCLRQIAAALRETAQRPTDLLARYGGEELACILPGTAQADATEIAEALCARVRELGIQHEARRAEGPPIVTISARVASHARDERTSGEKLVARADAALYRAKAAGRDRVEYE